MINILEYSPIKNGTSTSSAEAVATMSLVKAASTATATHCARRGRGTQSAPTSNCETRARAASSKVSPAGAQTYARKNYRGSRGRKHSFYLEMKFENSFFL